MSIEKQIDELVGKVNSTGEKLDAYEGKLSDYAVKSDVNKLADNLNQLSGAMEELRKQRNAPKNAVFGSDYTADRFYDFLVSCPARDLALKAGKNSIVKDLDTQTDAAGAHLIPDEFATPLIELIAQSGYARQLYGNEVVQTSAGTIEWPVGDAEAAALFTTNDTTDIDETSPTFGNVSLTPKQLAAVTEVSGKLLFNSRVSVANIVSVQLARAVGTREDYCVAKGTGAADSTNGSIEGWEASALVEEVDGLAKTSFRTKTGYDRIIDLMSAVHEQVENAEDCAFFAHRKMIHEMRKIKDDNGQPLWQPDFVGSPRGTIFGYPVKAFNQLSNLADTATGYVFFGSPKLAGKFVTGRSLAIAASEHVHFRKAMIQFRVLEDFTYKLIDLQRGSALARLPVTQ